MIALCLCGGRLLAGSVQGRLSVRRRGCWPRLAGGVCEPSREAVCGAEPCVGSPAMTTVLRKEASEKGSDAT